MPLPSLDPSDFSPVLDQIYSEDPQTASDALTGMGLTEIEITRPQFEEALAVLAAAGITLIPTAYAEQANDFVSAFNAYAVYMQA